MHAVVAGFEHHHLTGAADFSSQRRTEAAVRVFAELSVGQRQTGRPESGGALAHGGQEQSAARLVAPDMGRFLSGLDHQQAIVLRVEAVWKRPKTLSHWQQPRMNVSARTDC